MTTQEEQLKRQIHDLEKEVERLQSQIKHQQYGLVWLDVPEAFDEESESKIPILEEVSDKAICHDDGKPTHILIEGDNYHALTCLNYTHKGKVDVIYIDPPYNTGNDGFTYKDKRVLDKFPDGDGIKKNHPLRHSIWLSFMAKRLRLAKSLLSDNGVIFISIDDNEQANLKLLCDKVFGETNYVGGMIHQRAKGGGQAKNIVKGHDYILVYGNNIEKVSMTRPKIIQQKTFLINGEIYIKNTDVVRKVFGKYDKSMGDRRCYYEELERYKGIDKKQEIDGKLQSGEYFLEATDNGNHIICKYEKVEDARSKMYSIIKVLSEEGKKDLEELGLTNFSYPKPTELICQLIESNNIPNSIILDFFAGSGTTLHATMKQNEQDGGKRQCILCQINEGGICTDVTYERNRRVMNGYTDSKGNEIGGLGNSLKYYRTAFVGKNNPMKATDEDKLVLAKKAGCLLALAENTLYEQKCTDFYQVYSDEKGRYTAIYFQEDYTAYEDFLQEVKGMEGKRTVYVFSWGTGEEFSGDFEGMRDVTLRGIPQPILDIYKSLNQ